MSSYAQAVSLSPLLHYWFTFVFTEILPWLYNGMVQSQLTGSRKASLFETARTFPVWLRSGAIYQCPSALSTSPPNSLRPVHVNSLLPRFCLQRPADAK
jgi:hypothetical protein